MMTSLQEVLIKMKPLSLDLI